MNALPELGLATAGQAGRYRSVSLSGCTSEYTMAGLGAWFENRHLWRVSLPSLMSAPHAAEIAVPGYPRAERLLAREMRKTTRALLRDAECDLILIDFAGDHLVDFLRFEGCIVPDIRNGIFEPSWADIDLSSTPLLAGAEVLPGHSEAYWTVWRDSFAAFHAEILAPKIAAGTKVVILVRQLCDGYLAQGAEHRFDLPPAMQEATARLPGLYDWLARFPGLHFIRFEPALLLSAGDVPYGGPWPFHPVKEAFIQVQADLLRLMGEAEAARILEAEAMAGLLRDGTARAHERDQAQAAARQAEAERDTARAAARVVETERDVTCAALTTERDAARVAAAQLEAERDAIRTALTAERDAAHARIGELEQALQRMEAAHRTAAAEAALLQRVLGETTGRPGWRARLLRWSGMVELARHAARRRRWSQAERLYRLVLRLCPGQPKLWVQLGHMLKEQGAMAAALGAYRMAARLAPGEGDAVRHMAAVLEHLLLKV